MLRTFIGFGFKAGNGRQLFRHALLRAGAIAGVVLVVTFIVASSTVAAKRGSNGADEVHFFVGDKTCHRNSAPPLIVCVVTTSNVALLQGASIDYVSNPLIFGDPAPGRIDTDVVLTTTATTDGESSTADGHCTFYFSTGTGLCTFTHGTNSLAGFHATLVIGTNSDGTYSVIGKYWFGD